jgi:hypothetical protein
MVPNLPPSWRRAVRPALRRAPAPARVLVFASEFRLSPSRRVVPAGRVWIQVSNIGEDDHDLAVRRADGRLVAITPVIRPGRVATLKMRLSPGRYTLVCTVAGHEGHGMTAPLTVRRRARAGA